MINRTYMPEELEGDGFSKLVQVIRQVGANKDVRIEGGEVTKAPPEIEITLDDGLALESDDLTIGQWLSKRNYKTSIDNQRVTIDGNSHTLSADNITLKLDNELKVGERVVLISDEDTHDYFVIDRVFNYDDGEGE